MLGRAALKRTKRVKLQDIRAQRRVQSIDRHIGARMRERRVMFGLVQQQLAELIGITSQEVGKYERGINRISVSRLYMLAQALGVEVGYFYDGLGAEGGSFKPTQQHRLLLEVASGERARARHHAVMERCIRRPQRARGFPEGAHSRPARAGGRPDQRQRSAV